jgi:hypothetical protein
MQSKVGFFESPLILASREILFWPVHISTSSFCLRPGSAGEFRNPPARVGASSIVIRYISTQMQCELSSNIRIAGKKKNSARRVAILFFPELQALRNHAKRAIKSRRRSCAEPQSSIPSRIFADSLSWCRPLATHVRSPDTSLSTKQCQTLDQASKAEPGLASD